MPDELLATKLHSPQPRADAVPRPRLTDLVGRSPVTLVSAPAGYGKTTLVSEWVRAKGADAAWVSLDIADNDPGRFWSYVVGGLKTFDEKLGDSTLALLRSPQPTALESSLTPLINEVAASEHDLTLVLEDLHEIANSEVNSGLLYLIEYLPANLTLVLTSRADPALPLASLRASGKLTEIRAADLRFTQEEASMFLRREADVELSDGDIEALEERTEGWVVGLQMAAISMRGREDVGKFIGDFSGSNRYVLDYLVQEVLGRQPDSVQDFLLKTSILDRLTGSLCDALTGGSNGQTILEELDRGNLFTMPLDDERQWFRYHQLFAELLRRSLTERSPNEVPELRRRAITWFEKNGLVTEAIEHALLGTEYEDAARLIELEAERVLWRDSQRLTVARWLDVLPPELLRAHPKLALLHAWAKFTTGEWEAVEPLLEEAERELTGDDKDLAISGEIAAIRSGIAYEAGEMEESRVLAQRALDLVPESNPTVRSVVAYQLGLAMFWIGDYEAARENYDTAVEMGRAAENATIALMALGGNVQLAFQQGQMRVAERLYQQAKQLGTTAGGASLAPLGFSYLQMGMVFREHNELSDAERLLAEGVSLCEQQGGMPECVLEGLVMRARVLFDQGELDEMSATLRRADELLADMRLRSGDVQVIISPALIHRGRLALAQGNLRDATNWAENIGFDTEEEIDHTNRSVAILNARILLAGDEPSEALKIIDRSKNAWEEGSVEPLIVKSIALAAQKPEAAREALVEALPVAEREGYIRMFLDEGEKMRLLLEDITATSERASYANELLSAFEAIHAPVTTSGAISLVESLNERELSILRCMAGGLSNQDIANKLFISVNTVKWHARNLYGKLGVRARTKAVARARELNIL